jgi:CRP-like cAMP-binding protein
VRTRLSDHDASRDDKLLKLASWENAEAGECFVERDKPLDRLMVIYSGKACAEVDGRNVTEFQPGHFIGSISYVKEANCNHPAIMF